MSKIIFDSAISLDGYFAGDNRGPHNPIGDGGVSLHKWMFNQRAFLEMGGKRKGGEDGPDNKLLEATLARTGAYIMGKRMFDEGEQHWAKDLYKADVYVMTHEKREPWVQKGTTTFYFINDGIGNALEKAKKSAKGKISGSREVLTQYNSS